MGKRLLAALALALLPVAARAQVAQPVHHGCLYVRFAGGPFDPRTGVATLRVPGWRFTRATGSDGIFPAAEPVLIFLAENQYALDPGALHASRSGKVFSYRAPKGTAPPAIRRLRIKQRKDGSYSARFTLTGLVLEQIINADGLCLPMALIVGDDDFFSGVRLVRPGSLMTSKRFEVASSCVPNDWPMLGGAPPTVCPAD
jgi:hypothetical protein